MEKIKAAIAWVKARSPMQKMTIAFGVGVLVGAMAF